MILMMMLMFLFIKADGPVLPIFGDCGQVGYRAYDFNSCKGKSPKNSGTEYCCFLKAGKIQECVEVLKVDIDNNAVETTIKEIEKGIYEYWEDNNGINMNEIYGELDSFECDNNFFLQISPIIFLVTILLIF